MRTQTNPNSLANLRPAQPGNQLAKGRRNGWNLIHEFKKALAELERSDKEGRTRAQLLAQSTILRAIKGDTHARRDLLEYLHGRPTPTVEVETAGGTKTFEVKLSLEEVGEPEANGDTDP